MFLAFKVDKKYYKVYNKEKMKEGIKMKKKILALVLAIASLPTVAFASSFEGNFLDPFNNDLFKVVAETSYYKDYDMAFDTYEMIYSDDYSKAKVVRTKVDYDGKVTETQLCDFTDYETAGKYLEKNDPTFSLDPYRFNDGLARHRDEETYITGYKDVTGKIRYTPAGDSYFNFSYNLGLLTEIENDGWTGNDISEREYKTTFTRIMTDNKKYEFNCSIEAFNDDGYSLMRVNNKTYVIKLKKGIIPTVSYNGKKIEFDQIPVIKNGRTLVPLRAIFEKIGANIEWDEKTKTITATKGNTKIKLTINNKTATKNGEKVSLDVPAKIINGRTLVPVRFIADCFGVDVKWDETAKRVSLTSK